MKGKRIKSEGTTTMIIPLMALEVSSTRRQKFHFLIICLPGIGVFYFEGFNMEV